MPLKQLRLVPIPRISILGKLSISVKLNQFFAHYSPRKSPDHNNDFVNFILLLSFFESSCMVYISVLKLTSA
jgi:hypothetical protein